MSQWGETRVIDKYKFIPLIETQGFARSTARSLIIDVYILHCEDDSDFDALFKELKDKYIGVAYEQWLQDKQNEKTIGLTRICSVNDE